MASLSFKNIQKSYGDVPIIHGIDLEVEDGEFMVFVGPSGCGKSTLLRMIAGLEDIDGGELAIDGKIVNLVAPAQRGVAMVFQSYALYPHMSVADNMGFALKLAGKSKAEVSEAVRRAAEALQLTHLLDRKPKALSGGQRQRVAIGRAIVRTPKVFLFDEPLSNLDAALRVQMRLELARLHRELASTMVYVTHDQVEAMTLGNRIAVFNGGRIEQVGAPMDLYERPANLFVAGFLGSPKMNLMPATITRVLPGRVLVDVGGGVSIEVACRETGAAPGAAATLGFRPDHVSLKAPAEAALNGRVDLVERLGDATLVHVMCDRQERAFTVRLPGHTVPLNAGEAVSLATDAHRVCLFDESGRAFAAAHGGKPDRAA